MPKRVTADWLTILQTDPSFLCTIWRIERTDGQVFCFTTSVKDLAIADDEWDVFGLDLGNDAQTYQALAIDPSESNESSGVKANNLNLRLIVDDGYISERDLYAGKFDYAKVYIATADYHDLSVGLFDGWQGFLGAISNGKQTASADLNALAVLAEQSIGRLTKETCRHKFGGPKCGKNLAGNNPDGVPYTSTGVLVTAVDDGGSSRIGFTCSSLIGKPANFYRRGHVLWTDGENDTLQTDIQTFDTATGHFLLWNEMPESITVGDELTVVAGCEKTWRACWEDHDNARRMGLYPKAPTIESAGRINT